MKKISWCKRQKKGIKLVKPNENLSQKYYKNAEDSLKILRKIRNMKSNMWLATTKYYIEYFGIYSVLMKIGIKSEIHDCSIAIVKVLEKQGIFEKGIYKKIKKGKDLRIDNQYYLKNKPVNIDMDELSDFIISVRKGLDKLDTEKIKEIRDEMEKF